MYLCDFSSQPEYVFNPIIVYYVYSYSQLYKKKYKYTFFCCSFFILFHCVVLQKQKSIRFVASPCQHRRRRRRRGHPLHYLFMYIYMGVGTFFYVHFCGAENCWELFPAPHVSICCSRIILFCNEKYFLCITLCFLLLTGREDPESM